MRNTIAGPCQVKGKVIKNLKNYVNAVVRPGYFEELAQQVGFEHANLILASTWYPFDLFIEVQEVAAREGKIGLKKFIIDSSIFIIENELNGIYKFFLRVAGAPNILARIPQMNSTYTNFLDMDILTNEDGRNQVKVFLPEEFLAWYLPSLEGAVKGILKVCKRNFESISFQEPLKNNKGGQNLVEVGAEITYS